MKLKVSPSTRRTLLRLLCAAGLVAGPWLAIRGLLAWQRTGFAMNKLSGQYDGSELGLFIGILMTLVSWFALVASFQSDEGDSK
jgi:hypothetical protein